MWESTKTGAVTQRINIRSSGMNFDTIIFPSVKSWLSMKKLVFRAIDRGWKSASETVHLIKVYI